MITVDDRTPEQKQSHTWIVKGRDKCLSGWGGAEGGSSYAGWACKPDDVDQVEQWVRSRGDIQRVFVCTPGYHLSGGKNDHYHIYVVNENHPAKQPA